ncbi:MAG TPA: amidohydrolase family protein [Candidatus Acidoferrales bacterium]|nr:amidohydrolase family protein [Candidatus Acidoferrales bacterium]
MKGSARTIAQVILGLSIALSSTAQAPTSARVPARSADEEGALRAFAAIHPIDVHVHVFKTDPAFQKMLERLDLKLLNILVMDDTNPDRKDLHRQIDEAQTLVRSSRGHIALCTTFDPYKFDRASFTADAIKQIDRDFAQGAVAVKIWKNIGMEIKDSNGQYIMADDPKFELIYEDIASHGKTLMTHQAEPDVAWGPPNAADPSWSYYQENPQWYVANRPGFPSKQSILEARDHVLARNPKLRMVGVHLGSMERSLENIASHLDKYPNFAIDTAARMEYLMLMPAEKVSAFLIKYQDRVLYGTDLDLHPDANLPDALIEWQSTYARDWKFLATSETLTVEGQQVRGLNLAQPILQKIFRSNAIRWIPGL